MKLFTVLILSAGLVACESLETKRQSGSTGTILRAYAAKPSDSIIGNGYGFGNVSPFITQYNFKCGGLPIKVNTTTSISHKSSISEISEIQIGNEVITKRQLSNINKKIGQKKQIIYTDIRCSKSSSTNKAFYIQIITSNGGASSMLDNLNVRTFTIKTTNQDGNKIELVQ